MDANAEGFVLVLKRCFDGLPDPRVQGRCDHLLIDILAISLLAVMCGAEDWPEIEEFGKRRQSWLKNSCSCPVAFPRMIPFGGFLDCWTASNLRSACSNGRKRCTRPPAASSSPSMARRRGGPFAENRTSLPCTWSPPGQPRADSRWDKSPAKRNPTRSQRGLEAATK